MYHPDNWVIIKIKGADTHYRVLAGWSGSYLNGDSWRMNSGIVRVVDMGDRYHFFGYSGSCYSCLKTGYGIRNNIVHVISKLIKDDLGEVLPEETDWMNVNWVLDVDKKVLNNDNA